MALVSKWVCSVSTRRLWWQVIRSLRYCFVCRAGLNFLIKRSSRERSSERLQADFRTLNSFFLSWYRRRSGH